MERRGLLHTLLAAAVIVALNGACDVVVAHEGLNLNRHDYTGEPLARMAREAVGKKIHHYQPAEDQHNEDTLLTTAGIVTSSRIEDGMVKVRCRWLMAPLSGAFLTP